MWVYFNLHFLLYFMFYNIYFLIHHVILHLALNYYLHSWFTIFVYCFCKLVKVENYFLIAKWKKTCCGPHHYGLSRWSLGFWWLESTISNFPLECQHFKFSSHTNVICYDLSHDDGALISFMLAILLQSSSRTISLKSKMSELSFVACIWQILWICPKI